MKLSFYAVFVVVFLAVLGLNKATSMCFTWTLKRNEVQLICIIQQLMYDVSIIDQNGVEQASCLIPSLFEPKCVSYLHNGQIYQDIQTNTTIFTIWKADGSLNGVWTCRHGRGKEQTTTEVTITDYSYAFETNTEWTFIGLIATWLLLNVAIVIHSFVKCSGECCSGSKPSCLDKLSKKAFAGAWCLCLVITVLLSTIPIYLDSLGKSIPIPAQLFIADGFMIAISCHIMCNISMGTDKEHEIKEKGIHNQPKEHGSTLTEKLENHIQPTTSGFSSEKDNESAQKSDNIEQDQSGNRDHSDEHDQNFAGNNEEVHLIKNK